MNFFGKKQITIQLMEPIIYIRPTGCNAITNVLRGQIVLSLNRSITARSVVVRLVGKARTLWPEGVGKDKRLYDEEVIYDHTVIVPLPRNGSEPSSPTSPGTEISAGKRSFSFEMLLPNSMTESIEADRGVVSYKLYATVERSGTLATSLSTRRDVIVIHVPDDAVGDSVADNTITGHRVVPDILDYTVNVLGNQVVSGQTLPIHLHVEALRKGLRIEKLLVSITEKRVYESKHFGATRVENKELKLKPVLPTINADKLSLSFDELGGVWDQDIQFTMPNCSDKLHCCTTYKLIRVLHWIKLKLVVSFDRCSCTDTNHDHDKENRESRSYTLESPIRILSCRLVNDFVALPIYSEFDGVPVPSGFHCPCDGDYWQFVGSGRSTAELDYDVFGEAPPPTYDDVMAAGGPVVARIDSGHPSSVEAI